MNPQDATTRQNDIYFVQNKSKISDALLVSQKNTKKKNTFACSSNDSFVRLLIESPIGRITNTPQNKTWIRLRFLDAFLVSHRIMQDKESKNIHVAALDTCDVAFKFSPLRLVSSFWLSSEHLFLVSHAIQFSVYLSQREEERTDLASQNHNFVLHTERDAYFVDRHTARVNRSASQECRFATPTKNKPTAF